MQYYKIVTYGCQMNIHESEKMSGILESLGYTEAENVETADIIVFNTCCIRDTAESRALGNIGALKKLKKLNPNKIICVSGCMTQQKDRAEDIKKRYPFIDIILGTTNQHLLGKYLEEYILNRKKIVNIDATEKPAVIENEKCYRTSGCNAWINITYGCNNFCTYCIVPYVRGRERSRKLNAVLAEFRQMVDDGYKEITLLGQNVNSYGHDLQDGTNFATLLRKIDEIDGDFRVRFMTSHPKDINREIIDIIAKSKNLCKNIHLPIQSGSNNVLKAMNRHYTKEYYLDIIEEIKQKIPNCGITTDIMVGFPGETEQDFNDTLEVVKKVRYSSAFTFIYSPRTGTPAALMEQIPYEIKSERIQRLIKLQNKITKEISKEYEGRVFTVLCEGFNEKLNTICGRTDCGRMVNFNGDKQLIGKFVDVKISHSTSASLFGEVL
ncbi:MAG: tRNA (N6-isopentenyl adenosine(37)-C2)-methylthiotransferase MiaB [Clostridia bacterium]